MERSFSTCLNYQLEIFEECLGEHVVGQHTGGLEECCGDEADIERDVEDEDELGGVHGRFRPPDA